jgi:hypothetical protein
MEDKPAESETIVTEEVVPESDPVTEFKKGRAKREAKRKEVKVITEYVPEPPPTPVEAPPVDAESIAGRVADLLFAKMAVEKDQITPEKVKTKTRPRAAPKEKKESTPPPPPTKYFGWC